MSTIIPGPAVRNGAHRRLLDRVRRELCTALLLRALVAGLAVAAGVAVALASLDLLLDLPAAARALLGWAPLLAGATTLALTMRRLFPAPDDHRLALLAEERVPALGNVLATAVTPARAGTGDPDPLIRRLFEARLPEALTSAVPLRAGRIVRPRLREPALAMAVSLAILTLLILLTGGPTALLESWRRPAHEAPLAVAPGSPLGGARAGRPAVVRLGALRWTATPPPYAAGAPPRPGADEPIRALAGSRIAARVAVAGPEAEWSAALIGGGSVPAEVRGGWVHASFIILPELRGLELVARRDGAVVARRVVPLAPVADAPPAVLLERPARDEVLATGNVVVAVRARATDDHGVASLRIGWIRTRGSGESFTFEEGERAFELESRESGAVVGESRLDLGELGIGPGDVLHLRATATDRNDVTGPGVGVSATRVIRVAREGEEHEVTLVMGAPLDVEEQPVLSQRMIILMTERLRDRAPELSAREVAAEAAGIGREQGRLRARVGEILFVRSTGGLDTPEELADPFGAGYIPHGHAGHEHVEGDEDWDPTDPAAVLEAASRATGTGTMEELGHLHDEAPVIAVNRELLGAYNAMWDAERQLRQAAVEAALPPEYLALEILQRVREGERVFARGRVAVAPIDVDETRGTGELTGMAVAERSRGSEASTGSARAELALADAALTLPAAEAALAIASASARLLADGAIDADAAALLSRAADAAAGGRRDAAAGWLAAARSRLEPALPAPTGAIQRRASDAVGAEYHRRLAVASARPATPAEVEPRPFVFATARYASGNWDSAPLVPSNLIHSLARYTEIPVAPEGVVVDLASSAVLEHPFLFLTGHLPVRFDDAESRNLRLFVERGGFIFIDDHNHDIDGAFHRTVTAELARIFGQDALRQLPNDHELYSAFFRFDDGPPTTVHELNDWGDGLIHEHLLAIEVDGRIAVLYSNKDYSSEWNYHAANKRFLAVDNTRFGVNILVYALTR